MSGRSLTPERITHPQGTFCCRSGCFAAPILVDIIDGDCEILDSKNTRMSRIPHAADPPSSPVYIQHIVPYNLFTFATYGLDTAASGFLSSLRAFKTDQNLSMAEFPSSIL